MSKLIEYHKSIGEELTVIKNRVRNLLGESTHWPSDGRHKESILKAVLEKHLPQSISASNGFIRFKDECSSEIDILMHDNTKPLLFKSNDLVITSPKTVFGAIEVKTDINSGNFEEALFKLADNCEKTSVHIRTNLSFHEIVMQNAAPLPWFSLFSFDCSMNVERLMNHLNTVASGKYERVIKCICLGPNKFIRFWEHEHNSDPENPIFIGWKLYDLDGLAFSYFISNMIWQDSISSAESNMWFALDEKQKHAVMSVPFSLPKKGV